MTAGGPYAKEANASGEGVLVPPTATEGGRPVVQQQQQVQLKDDDDTG
jgi:hypothetical protein